MAKLEVSDADIKKCENLLKAMKKPTWSHEGEQALAFADAWLWLISVWDKMKQAVTAEAMAAQARDAWIPPTPSKEQLEPAKEEAKPPRKRVK